MSSAVPVVRELALVEGRHLLVHPASLAGYGILAMGCAAYLRSTWSGVHGLDDDGWVLYAGFALLAALVMVAVNFVASRDVRKGTAEQHQSLPTSATRRVSGVLGALLAPFAVVVVALAVVTTYLTTQGAVSRLEFVVLASAAPLLLMLGSLGVALARWLPNPFLAPATALALYFWVPSDPEKAWQVLMPLNPGDDLRSAGWHIVYLLGLAATFASVALASARPRRRGLLLAAASAGVTATAVAAAAMLS